MSLLWEGICIVLYVGIGIALMAASVALWARKFPRSERVLEMDLSIAAVPLLILSLIWPLLILVMGFYLLLRWACWLGTRGQREGKC